MHPSPNIWHPQYTSQGAKQRTERVRPGLSLMELESAMTINRTPALSNADSSVTANSPPQSAGGNASDDTSHSQIQDLQRTMASIDGLDDGRNAWSDEGQDNPHPSKPLPEALRAGPPDGPPDGPPKISQAVPQSNNNTNPYLQKQVQEMDSSRNEDSANAWGRPAELPAQPSEAQQVEPLSNGAQPPSQQFTSLSVSEPSTNPWQPALDEVAASRKTTPEPTQLTGLQDRKDGIWSQPPPEKTAPAAPEQEDLIDLEEDSESPAWDEDDGSSSDNESISKPAEENPGILDQQNVWDDTRGQKIDYDAIDTNKYLSSEINAHQVDGWSLVDREPVSDIKKTGIVKRDAKASLEEQFTHSTSAGKIAYTPPILSAAAIEAAEKQKKETYEIKKITWHDATAAKNPRISPILVQNANGPCPLLALINALTLSTPAEMETALVDTLRSREQVSLGLLLDAVIDELMSGRRGDAIEDLPDVSDLYYFLITLHTGMNVNPRFFPAPPSKSTSDPRNSMSHVHPAEREESIPGTFEDTREMKLYSTFSIPLIHGWLPAPNSTEYIALKRSAPSYEDGQNLMFHEEELEDKLDHEGLSFEEQATLEDISTIKAFFETAATQLTAYGLDTITTSLAPGAVAILFRNDHFSTLYRHPDTLQLHQLVTDMGYAGHEEVVWESLMDVNGEKAEFFSGDFRLVGGAPTSPAQSYSRTSSQSNAQWTTVGSRNQGRRQSTRTPSPHGRGPQAPQSPVTEQEDHDLALALQLQEEEEERHRDEVERRRRETELSQQYIEQQGSQRNVIPVTTRGGGSRRGGRGGRGGPISSPSPPRQPPRPIPQPRESPEQRPEMPPRPGDRPEEPPNVPQRTEGAGGQPIDPEAGVDAPPPSYEQARTQAAYVPPADHPSHPGSDPSNPRRPSQYSGPSESGGTGRVAGSYSSSGIPRRRPVPVQTPSQRPQERDRDCTVM
ncbi:hypothetical protein OIDMADRAFT_146703 [Oidiodendron maius Zn]|uniref:MINDY deubiquitinase domain-containing protein n=1 Tax=Oidiodendron maius (strain Zn) TaxID=913774 RepID=A0A0C3DAU1_OIDMZ|nr:hypothetical protein OIDMADRAFT_146703 [Oidiodendron maius Zn]